MPRKSSDSTRSTTAEVDFLSFSLTVELPKPRPWKRWSKVWQPVSEALAARLRYCAIPVQVDRVLVSRQSPFAIPETLLSWLSPAQESEHTFPVFPDINQIVAPHLLPPQESAPEVQLCSLMLNVRRDVSLRGMAEVHWIRDGALIGPVLVRGPTGAIGVDIICPGDHPRVNLSEWAIQNPDSFFRDQRILAVCHQLVTGLESLMGSVSDSLERNWRLLKACENLPEPGDRILVDLVVGTKEDQALFQCLPNQDPVKGVTVMEGELACPIEVSSLNGKRQ